MSGLFDPSPAEEAASPAVTDLNGLALDVMRDGAPTSLPFIVEDATLSGRIKRTVEGASELTLVIHDPDWALLDSGLFETDASGRFTRDVDVRIGPLWFRLVKLSPAGEQVTLTFEDREVALLRAQTAMRVSDRADTTMAEFADRLIRATHDDLGRLRSWIPELHEQQAIAKVTPAAAADTTARTSSDARREPGLPARMKIHQWDGGAVTLSSAQTANAEIVLATAAALKASPKATKALVEACIVEPAGFQGSGPFDNPNGGDGTSVGILQATNAHFGGSTSTHGGRRDVAAVCKKFLTTGFTGPKGAIPLAKANPTWSAGQIAQSCQGSKFGARYDQVGDSAQALMDAYSGGGGRPDATTDRTVAKPYRYRVSGDYWKTLTDYAQSVNWRCFVANGVVYFVSEERLFESRARTTFSRSDADDLTFDWDARKAVAQVTFSCRADFWAAPPGSVVVLTDAGPASGRWLVSSTERGLVDPTTTITLAKPMLKKAEAAPETTTATSGSGSSDGPGTPRDGGFPSGSHLARAYAEMRTIDQRNYAYKYGGGHGAGFTGGPYDCSGAVSAVLHAAGFLDAPQATPGLLGWGQPGEGRHLTVWVLETGDGHTSHTFITVKTPDGKTRFFEAGGADSAHTGFHRPRSTQGFQPRHWPGL